MVTIEGNTRADGGKSIENETPETYRERWDMTGKAQYSQNLFLEKILTFIREHRDEPFFLFHPTQLPHGPVAVPSVDPEVAADTTLTPIEKEYASMVKLLDDQVGAIVAEVRRLGLEDNTIIVFASDNGHEIYYSQAGRCEKPYRNLRTGELFDDYRDKYYSDPAGDVFNGNGGLAGLKRSNLEGGVNVPLVFYWKGHIPAGAASGELVSNYDFLPTMAQMLGVRLPVRKDGISYWPLLQGKRWAHGGRYVVFGSNYGPAVVMSDGWKLRYYRAADAFELYNLNDDPQERENLILRYPERAEKLKGILLEECAGDLENGVNRAG
ncbi:MAG: sulfatase-like hydrolase/transferase [Rikenellaceae bacterium]|nr:sulfatase-like hydrolase/transferase [Rikenellaceae bacterium]